MGNWGKLREKRVGVCVHYDGSGSDAGAVNWLTKHPEARVSYHRLILDDGQVIPIAPLDSRAWHAGVCRPSDARLTYTDANSALYGLAFAAKPGDELTAPQFQAMVREVAALFRVEGWSVTDWWRITDHAAEAWPRGRKADIGRGLRMGGHVVDISTIRQAVTTCLLE